MALQRQEALACGSAPHLGGLITGRGRDAGAVWGDGDRFHAALVPLQRPQAIARGRAPYLGGVVEALPCGGDVERRQHDERQSGALA
eukprot:10268620-Alexandrium_andersonii.AAC.1